MTASDFQVRAYLRYVVHNYRHSSESERSLLIRELLRLVEHSPLDLETLSSIDDPLVLAALRNSTRHTQH